MIGPLSGLRIGLLTAWASRRNGGVFEAVVRQAALIRELGGEAPMFALCEPYAEIDRARFAPGEVHHFPVLGPAGFGFAPAMLDALIEARLDCLHLHGIWMYPSIAATRWARRTGRAYLLSVHGMLDPWITARNRSGRIKKAIARPVYERESWRTATRLHALTAAEAANIAAEAGRTDSLVIPNPAPAPGATPPAPRGPTVVAIGRIHPVKNVGALVEGWRRARLPDGARLVLAGWGEPGDVAALERAVAAAGESVEFVGPKFGADKQALLDRARFIALPSFSEALPMAVLEGWAQGIPAVISRESNLPEGYAAGAALPCGLDPAAIAAALETALTIDEGRWRTMSDAARTLAAGPFSQASIAARWGEAYLAAIAAASAR